MTLPHLRYRQQKLHSSQQGREFQSLPPSATLPTSEEQHRLIAPINRSHLTDLFLRAVAATKNATRDRLYPVYNAGVIDTTTASGELIFNIFSSLAQFERRLIQERTRAGLSAATARGRMGGRKPLDPSEPRVQMAQAMYRDKEMEIKDICRTLKISRSTLYRYVGMDGASEANARAA